MSININRPNCHIISSLMLSKLSAQVPISALPSSRGRQNPTADLSDIPIDVTMRRALPLDLPHRKRSQHQMARHGRGYHVPGYLVNLNYAGHPNLPILHGQPQQLSWEGFGIPTRNNGDAQYAIHRAIQYAYDKGYRDARKSRTHYHSFKKVLDETDRKELEELKDRLSRERIGEMRLTDIGDSTASQIRELLKEARWASQRHHGGHKENQDRTRRDKSRARSHYPRNTRRNHKNSGKRFRDTCKCACGNSEDSSSSESYDEDDYAYR